MNLTEFKQQLGKTLDPGKWYLIKQEDITQFAELTKDVQYIHVDVERAKDTWLGGTVAHGLMVLSLLPKLSEGLMPIPDNILMSINYGFDKVRFLHPVRPGNEIRMQAVVSGINEKEPGRYVLKLAINVEIKGVEKPALVCEWMNLFVVP